MLQQRKHFSTERLNTLSKAVQLGRGPVRNQTQASSRACAYNTPTVLIRVQMEKCLILMFFVLSKQCKDPLVS